MENVDYKEAGVREFRQMMEAQGKMSFLLPEVGRERGLSGIRWMNRPRRSRGLHVYLMIKSIRGWLLAPTLGDQMFEAIGGVGGPFCP